MKLRSLFLAGIAAFAMASCSNEVEGIDNGGDNGNKEENALMQFRFSYGNATTGVRDANSEAGLDIEQKFETALLVIDYTNGTTANKVKEIARTEFTPTTDPATNGKYFQSVPFSVSEGEMQAYVVLNPTSAITSTLKSLDGNTNDVTAAINAAKITAIADASTASKFIMYGYTAEAKELVVNETTPVNVAVSRIVAKIKEETAAANISKDVTKSSTGQDLTIEDNKTVNVTLTGYAFTNLTESSNLAYQSANKIAPTLNLFNGVNAIAYDYNNAIGTPAANTQITYCFENDNIEKNANAEQSLGAGNTITSVIYKAKIKATGINDTEATKGINVYVYNDIVYNYQGLKTAYEADGGDLTLTDETGTINEFEARNIRKYEAGVCYYRHAITTGANENKIKRNNVYKLSVTDITKLGFATPIPVVDQTAMRLNLEVVAWTVNTNAFPL